MLQTLAPVFDGNLPPILQYFTQPWAVIMHLVSETKQCMKLGVGMLGILPLTSISTDIGHFLTYRYHLVNRTINNRYLLFVWSCDNECN